MGPKTGHGSPRSEILATPLGTNICKKIRKTILFTRIGGTPVSMVRILSVITFRYNYECLHDIGTERSAAGLPNRFDEVTSLPEAVQPHGLPVSSALVRCDSMYLCCILSFS